MNYIITYDITNNKRRKKLSDLLEGYGIRVNFSVFECELTKTQLNKIIEEITYKKLINKKEDSIRFYHIHQDSIAKSFELCNKPEPFEPVELFIWFANFFEVKNAILKKNAKKKLANLCYTKTIKNDLRTFIFALVLNSLFLGYLELKKS